MLREGPVHLDTLDGKSGADTRLTQYSDIAALMVFEHQARTMKSVESRRLESRIALAENHELTPRAASR